MARTGAHFRCLPADSRYESLCTLLGLICSCSARPSLQRISAPLVTGITAMFKNMKLDTKLISAFDAVCVLGAVVSAIGIGNMISVNASTAGYTSHVNGSVAQLDQMKQQ